MQFIIAQILGLVVAFISLGCVQFKSEKIILIGQFLSNFLTGISCALLGGLAGAWICILASVQTLIISFIGKNDKGNAQTKKNIVSLIFALAYIAGTLLTYQSWADFVVCICAMLFTLTIIQENSGKMRTVMIFNMALWVIYDFSIGAYTNIITHGSTMISVITAKLRLDKTGDGVF